MKRFSLFLLLAGAAPVVFGQWGLLGNGSTNPGTNYLGTTDNNALMLRTNATQRLRLNANQSYTIGSFTAQAKNGAPILSQAFTSRQPVIPKPGGATCDKPVPLRGCLRSL